MARCRPPDGDQTSRIIAATDAALRRTRQALALPFFDPMRDPWPRPQAAPAAPAGAAPDAPRRPDPAS